MRCVVESVSRPSAASLTLHARGPQRDIKREIKEFSECAKMKHTQKILCVVCL